jgi:polysaccharide export outer membrane protein
MILLMAALAACGTTPVASTGQDTNPATALAPDTTATAEAKDAVTAPMADAATESVKAAPETVSRDTYVIQPGDVITISVWREKDLQGEMAVRPDGGINFPLVGEIIAAGKTIEQLKADISTKLAKYVPDPVVTATVKNSLGNKIFVIGKVNKPGEYVTNRTVDVMQALSMAGGPNPYASVNKIKILRRINGEQKTFFFKYSRVEKGKDLEQNIVLQGGDIVIVP